MSQDRGAAFRALHQKGSPFVLANVWDRGTAKVCAGLGAKALATSSAAHAFTLGRLDGTVTRDEALEHAEQVVGATPLPVQGDFENGFGESPEICAETVRLAAEIGLAGICIEDTALPGSTAYDFELSVERIRAAAAAARALPQDFVLTARADGVLTGHYDGAEALRRLLAFEEAGADCLYAPIPGQFDLITKICAQTTAPVNVLIFGEHSHRTHSEFEAIGAARLSLGSSLASVAQRAVWDTAEACLGGDYTRLDHGFKKARQSSFLED